ncbi:MAG: oligosaccharide flippase family protein [Rhizobiales bacterium]|nr:oligosaccharide flippase family protein [Hyphomicrobiales bacterium]
MMRSVAAFPAAIFAALRGSRSRAYLKVLAVVSGARLFGLASQFVVLVILSRILTKDSFGDMMTAFGFYRLAGVALGVGPSLLLVFHISRRPHDQETEIKLHRYSAILGAVVSATVALVGYLGAGPIATALHKPGLAVWFELLAPFAVFSTLLVVAAGALEGRSRISESIVLSEVVPNAIRIVLLPLVALASLPASFVAHVLTLSVLLPWLWAARRMWNREIAGTAPWTRWDYSYSGKFVFATLFAYQLGGADILVAGALFSSEAVADYAVASRLAALYGFFQLALLKRFAPRAGHLQETGDLATLRQEIDLCRRLVIGCTVFTICGIFVLAPYILPVFGNYKGAEALLIWLAIPSFVVSFYATSDRLLISAGQANIAVALTGASFLVLTMTPFVTAPWLGMLAIPAAMILSAILLQPVVAVRVQRLFNVRTITPGDAAMMVCGTLAIAGYAMTRTPASAAAVCTILAIIGLVYMIPVIRRSRPHAEATAA